MSRRCVSPARITITALLMLALCGCPLLGGPANTKPAPTAPGTPTTATPSKPSGKPAASSVIAAAPTASSSETRFREALQLMQARDYGKAEPLLTELTRKQPQFAGPWLDLGILYARTNRKQQALQALRQGLTLNSKSAPAQNQLGILLRETGDLKSAEQAYKSALAAMPDYANAHLNLGVLYDVYLKQPNLALKHYEQYQRLVPADSARVAVWIAGLKLHGQNSP